MQPTVTYPNLTENVKILTNAHIPQISKELLSSSQRNVFADMVKDIVRQLKLNPNQIPVPQTTHRRTGSGLEKVCTEYSIQMIDHIYMPYIYIYIDCDY